MKNLSKKTRRQMWKTIRRGIERGTIKNHRQAAAASIALCRGFALVYSPAFKARVQKVWSALSHLESSDSSS